MLNSRTSNNWLSCLSPRPQARLRLFCVPYAGGGASIFRQWASRLPGMVELCCIQLPGREIRLSEPPIDRLTRVVPPLAQALQPYLQKPFALFGHSMGALISFELARYLRKVYGRSARHLFVAGQRAPQFPDSDEPIHDLPDDAFLAAAQRLNGIPEEVLHNQEWLRMLLPVLRADFTICETYTYTPGPPLPCPISVFGGQDDTGTRHEHLAGWSNHTSAAFSLRMLPGDHFFLSQAQSQLTEALAHDLSMYL